MANLSFLIVACEASECLVKVCDSINRAINDYPIRYTYEILISSFDEIKIPNRNVVWVEDKLKKPGNTVQAYNHMAKESKGDYLFTLNDDHMFPNSNSLRAVEFLQSDVFKNRKYKVTGISSGPNTNRAEHWNTATCIPNGALWRSNPDRFPDHAYFPEELKNPRFDSHPHRYLVWGYPVFQKQTLIEHFGGYLFNPSFRHHFADNWLPFWYGESSGDFPLMCEDTAGVWCPSSGPTSTVNNDAYDYKVFCALCVKFIKEGGIPYDTKITVE